MLLISYTFVFSVCLQQTPGPGEVTQNFPLFIFAGMLPWLLFTETLQRSATSLLEQSTLITKTVFPSEVVPVAIFLSSLVSHLIAVALALCGALIFLHRVSPALLALPVFIVLLGLFAVGLAWVAAGLQVYLRDTAQVLAVVLTLWFWVTPILASEQRFPRASEVPAGVQSAGADCEGLPRNAARRNVAASGRDRRVRFMEHPRIYWGRAFLPLYEARVCGRVVGYPVIDRPSPNPREEARSLPNRRTAP